MGLRWPFKFAAHHGKDRHELVFQPTNEVLEMIEGEIGLVQPGAKLEVGGQKAIWPVARLRITRCG